MTEIMKMKLMMLHQFLSVPIYLVIITSWSLSKHLSFSWEEEKHLTPLVFFFFFGQELVFIDGHE